MITIIAALDPMGVIGSQNDLPWNYPEDLRHFKKITRGQVVIMGRKTFESLPNGPLPNRTNVVISRNFHHEGVETFASLESAIQHHPDCFIIGGSEIYHLGIELADRMILTHIHHHHMGDRFFPEFGKEWYPRDTQYCDDFNIVEYRRVEARVAPE